MLPTKSNSLNKGCSPVSSNCVIWQGPCLECINIQTGDTISDITFKLAEELCELKSSLDLSDVELKCLFTACATCPDPEKTLNNILTLLINKVCALDAIINTPEPPEPEELLIRVAACFQTPDVNGDPILDLPISDYVRSIGNRVCAMLTTLGQHTSSLTNHETRITALEEADGGTNLPTIVPTCLFGSDTSPKALDIALSELEEQFCALRSATGSPAEIVQAAGKQCASLNSASALSSAGTMAGLAGWKPTVSNLADTLNNMWMTICDMRVAVDAVQDCCSATCADIKVDFIANVTDNGQSLKLYFSGYSIIPSGFTDCDPAGSKLTITDGISGTHIMFIPIATAAASPDPITININATPLNPTGTYKFTLESCMKDGSLTCNKTVIVSATGTALSCNPPTNVVVSLV